MTDEKNKKPDLEAIRLEVERARLKIDAAAYQDQRTRTFLERWRTDVQPLHEATERSRDMAFGYSKMGIQTMVLLNGGALVAFPAFAQLVGSAFTEHVTYALLGVGGFVAGLVFIAATSLLAFMSIDADKLVLQERQAVVKMDLNRAENPEGFTETMARQREDREARGKGFYRRAERLRTYAVGLAVGSLVAFLVGAFFAAMVLSGAASASTRAEAIEATSVVAEVVPHREEDGGGGNLTGLVTWTDEHQGAVVALATVVVAVASVASFIVAFFLAKENRLLRKAGTEPEVAAYLLPDKRHPTTLNFVLANIGQGPARNVEYRFEADAEDFAAHNVHVGNTAKRTVVAVLPQGERIAMLFGTGWETFKEPRLKPFKVEVSFHDLKGKRRSAKFDLDVAQFDGMITSGTPAEHEIAEAMKKFAKTIESWSSSTSGRSRLAVETITTDEGRKRMEEWRAARNAQRDAKDPGVDGATK